MFASLAIQVSVFVGCFAIAYFLAIPIQRLFRIQLDPAGRLSQLEGLRALAALAVVACHVNQHTLLFFGHTENPDVGNHIGVLAVQMFFSLTAYLFTSRALKGKLEPATFYISRLRRTMPLYIFVATLAVVIGLHDFPGVMPSMFGFIKQLIEIYTYPFFGYQQVALKDGNALAFLGIAWTLCYEFGFYLILVPLYLVTRSSTGAFIVVALGVAAVAARDYSVSPTVVWASFLPGSLAAIVQERMPARISPLAGYAIFAIAALLGAVSVMQTGYGYTIVETLCAGYIFFAVLFVAPACLSIKPLLVLGRISYSIYLTQALVLSKVTNFASERGVLHASLIWKFFASGAVVAILIPFSAATFRWVELPWMQEGHGRKNTTSLVNRCGP
jgi:peptidoglycan/LPS O-acetylase OafA/YrhL